MSKLRSRPVRTGALVRRGRPARPLRGEAVSRGMRIGLFGGSFDPPHDGHRHVAETAMKRLGLHRVWWLVSPQNPLKSRGASRLGQRLASVEELASAPGMVVTDLESRLRTRRTADLLQALGIAAGKVDFVWLMGADNLAQIHRWSRWREIFDKVPVLVMSRPQDPIRARLSPAARIYARSRRSERSVRELPLKSAPAWTYLTERLHSHSSTALRARR